MFGRKNDNPEQREYREAKADLNTRFNNKHTSEDDPEYLAATQRVIDAEKHVPWSRR